MTYLRKLSIVALVVAISVCSAMAQQAVPAAVTANVNGPLAITNAMAPATTTDIVVPINSSFILQAQANVASWNYVAGDQAPFNNLLANNISPSLNATLTFGLIDGTGTPPVDTAAWAPNALTGYRSVLGVFLSGKNSQIFKNMVQY